MASLPVLSGAHAAKGLLANLHRVHDGSTRVDRASASYVVSSTLLLGRPTDAGVGKQSLSSHTTTHRRVSHRAIA